MDEALFCSTIVVFMTWGQRRQFMYVSVILILLAVVIGIPTYNSHFNKVPTCFDNIQNQNEESIDCGGVCKKLCEFESLEPHKIFERFFNIGGGDNFAVALVENLNKDAYAFNASYLFKIYDKDNILLEERYGKTFIPTGKIFALSEHTLYTGEREPAKVTFEFIGPINWQRGNLQPPLFKVLEIAPDYEKEKPEVRISFQNEEVYRVDDVTIVAILSDEQGNVIAASQTIFESIPGQAKNEAVFVWPKPIETKPAKVDVYINALPRL